MTYNYIYLLQTRECLAIRQNIYKIGKTTQPLLKRFKQYPKGAVLLHQTICVNCHTLEQQLNTLIPLIQQAKQDTIKTYSQNPNFSVIYGTDMAQDYLNDLIDLFKK